LILIFSYKLSAIKIICPSKYYWTNQLIYI